MQFLQSELMKFYNSIIKDIKYVNKKTRGIVLKNFCILLSPLAPHITEEIWSSMGFKSSVHNELWPKVDENALEIDSYELVIQINGKVRDKLIIPADSSENLIKEMVLKRNIVQKWLNNKSIKKIILVKGRIFNIVIWVFYIFLKISESGLDQSPFTVIKSFIKFSDNH